MPSRCLVKLLDPAAIAPHSTPELKSQGSLIIYTRTPRVEDPPERILVEVITPLYHFIIQVHELSRPVILSVKFNLNQVKSLSVIRAPCVALLICSDSFVQPVRREVLGDDILLAHSLFCFWQQNQFLSNEQTNKQS